MDVPIATPNNTPPPLPAGVSLRLHDAEGGVLLEDSGKWLYPLFGVEEFLRDRSLSAEDLILQDKIAGRAAASLIVRMGFRSCFIETISRPALDVFERHGVDCIHGTQVDRIQCRTEDLITADMDLETVYRMLRKRAGLTQGKDLSIRDLEAGYGGRPVLKGLDLELAAGDQLIVTGDNGTGKSTLLKTLVGTVPMVRGEIRLGGAPLPRTKAKPSPIGYVNQSMQTSRFPLTAEEIVAFGSIGHRLSAAERRYRIEIAMKRTGCFHLAGRDVGTLSGGERQRVSLARCLSQEAAVILLDEPTSFLDRESKNDFLGLLRDLVRSRMPTVLLVSHDHEWVGKLDWPIRVLKDGVLC